MVKQSLDDVPALAASCCQPPRGQLEVSHNPQRQRRHAAFAFIVALISSCSAMAHDWMPADTRWCCNDRDCRAAARTEIERTGEGWRIKATGQTFRDGERGIYPNYAPDKAEAWICKMPTEPAARCIFILPEGS